MTSRNLSLSLPIGLASWESFSFLGSLQKLGRALMLPIAVLPIAGLLLRLGSPDVLDIKFMMEAGGAIFKNLALIFAIGVGVGISKDNAGAAGLAGAIGYLVFVSSIKTISANIDMGVFAGIVSGVTAGLMYNRFHQVRFPDWLAFFGGKRFVPIVTAGVVLLLSAVFGLVWPSVQKGIDLSGQWMIHSESWGAFAYGTLNRLLIPTGLHQVINSVVWFVFGEYKGATGDLGRFFAGDPNAGIFMAGFFPVMMFGLPAACLAMYRTAQPEKKKAVAGILFGVGLTSLVTGVTEPVEFLFMFLAPALFLVHALLTGLSLAVCGMLGIKAGFTFSGGAIDYLLNYPLATNGWMILPLGALWFLLYYGIFTYFIEKFDLKTPGREAKTADAKSEIPVSNANLALNYVACLGGLANLREIDCCVTRLRLLMKDRSKVDEAGLRVLGAKGVVKVGTQHLQVIVGSQVESLCDAMRALAKEDSAQGTAKPQPQIIAAKAESAAAQTQNSPWDIVAPMTGQLIALDMIPDPVFSEGMAGDGIAILPSGDLAVAPCDGILEKIFWSNHAFALRSDEGAEILVHIGIDTVSLKGEGFTRIAQEGQRMKKGDPIVSFDRKFLTENAKSLMSPVLVTNPEKFSIAQKQAGMVHVGRDLAFRIESTPI